MNIPDQRFPDGHTFESLLHLTDEISDMTVACQQSLNQLSITPELLSVNCQNTSLAGAEAQFASKINEHPEIHPLDQAITNYLMRKMDYIKHATRSLRESNREVNDRVYLLGLELQMANNEYWPMKTTIDEKDEKQLKYFIMKQDEYVKRAVFLKEKMISSGITARGQYKSVIDYSVDASRSDAQLAEVTKMLSKYCNLPSDINEAKKKVIEAKARFKKLEEILNQKIVTYI